MIPSEKDWIVIFNTNSEGWGSYDYDEALDALRVTVTPVEAPFRGVDALWIRRSGRNISGRISSMGEAEGSVHDRRGRVGDTVPNREVAKTAARGRVAARRTG